MVESLSMLYPQWQVLPTVSLPTWFLEIVKAYAPESEGKYAAQLLWQRGIQTAEKLSGFLDPNCYQPVSPFEFGQEMKLATNRLKIAVENQEKVTIWGDFDADGITATSVLWDGLGQFLIPDQQLNYYIPNRATESHGLNVSGIEKLATEGTQLIITCDTGSTNITEINYANQLGIDIIVTDHHTLPDERPPVVAIINPRYFSADHPLFSLSGVAVAYKVVEALYQTLPDIPQQPLENLLDLVAIGLIADLVELKGDCRYLAQKGIEKLQQQLQNPTRPGIAFLLQFCKRAGDRPTDISYGIGPRINAISRIHGDASFGVELLTSRDKERCQCLAEETELANTRRKALQKTVSEAVKKQLATLDLSTTHVIVLDDPQWQSGVLGLVAGQIAQEYGRPTILLTTNEGENSLKLAKGSARSVHQIDLYQLVASQRELLHRFGGHPFAAGLSLPMDNLPIFREAINQKLRQEIIDINALNTTLTADLSVTVSHLGKSLFKELKLLEPCGMGNPVPTLLIQNCWFKAVENRNLRDIKNQTVKYIRTKFKIYDRSNQQGFPGIWWGHYQEELPQGEENLCDAMVELDYNSYSKNYEVRLIAVRQHLRPITLPQTKEPKNQLIDWRNRKQSSPKPEPLVILNQCPTSWNEIQKVYQKSFLNQETLALAYSFDAQFEEKQFFEKLIGVAKYLARTQQFVTSWQLKEKLLLSDRTLPLALDFLETLGFQSQKINDKLRFTYHLPQHFRDNEAIKQTLIEALSEEYFQRQYFATLPIETLQEILTYGKIEAR